MPILRHSTTEKNNESESVCNSSRQLAKPNYKKAGAKPPIKPKSEVNIEDGYVNMGRGNGNLLTI